MMMRGARSLVALSTGPASRRFLKTVAPSTFAAPGGDLRGRAQLPPAPAPVPHRLAQLHAPPQPPPPPQPARRSLWHFAWSPCCVGAARRGAQPIPPARLPLAAGAAQAEPLADFAQGEAIPEAKPLYLDLQATTPTDPRVLDTMMPFSVGSFGNPHSRTHAYGWEAEDAVEVARKQVADLIGADAREIIWTRCALRGRPPARGVLLAVCCRRCRGQHLNGGCVCMCVVGGWGWGGRWRRACAQRAAIPPLPLGWPRTPPCLSFALYSPSRAAPHPPSLSRSRSVCVCSGPAAAALQRRH